MEVIPCVPGSQFVRTNRSSLRIGCSPDSAKFSRGRDLPAADVVVMHRDPWLRNGTALCALECDFWGKLFGPAGFFDQGEKLFIVCRPQQVDRVWTILRHAFQGPSAEELTACGVDQTEPWKSWADRLRIRKSDGELLQLAEVVEIVPLEGRTPVRDVRIEEVDDSVYVVDDGKTSATVDVRVDSAYEFPFELPVPEIDPRGARLAVHTLGCYSGTDPHGPMTCFRIVADGQEFIIDGMPGLNDALSRLDVDPREIRAFLLSHVHQDHMWSAIEQMVGGSRIPLMCAPAVYASFVSLVSAITGLDHEATLATIDWTRLAPGEPISLRGVEIAAAWVVGPIPTTGFRFRVGDASLVFSADTLSRSQMVQRGLPQAQIEQVVEFCLSGDFGIVDCGGASGDPVHGRPEDWLADARRLGRRIVGTHTSEEHPGMEMTAPGKVEIVLPAADLDR